MSVLRGGRVLRGKVFNTAQRDFFKGIFSVISPIFPCLATILIYLLFCSSEFLFTEGRNVNCEDVMVDISMLQQLCCQDFFSS